MKDLSLFFDLVHTISMICIILAYSYTFSLISVFLAFWFMKFKLFLSLYLSQVSWILILQWFPWQNRYTGMAHSFTNLWYYFGVFFYLHNVDHFLLILSFWLWGVNCRFWYNESVQSYSYKTVYFHLKLNINGCVSQKIQRIYLHYDMWWFSDVFVNLFIFWFVNQTKKKYANKQGSTNLAVIRCIW